MLKSRGSHYLGVGTGSFVWCFFFSSRRRHTRLQGDWSSDVCSSDLWLRWTRSPAALVLVLLVAALALAVPFYRHRNLTTSLPPDKSIAVLPFVDLSQEIGRASCRGRV